jgi:hypothetical protein
MHVERKVDRIARVVTLTLAGDLDDAGLLALPEELEKIPELAPDFSLLIDLREASGSKVTSVGVRRLAERSLVLSVTSRRAVVVRTDLGFGMSRMYEMLRKNHGATRVFRDYDEAWRWVTTGTP